MAIDEWSTAVDVLRLAAALVEDIQTELAEQGFPDVRPAHGFAFARISGRRATVADLAEHLGTTKQAASQLVEQLVSRGYLVRRTDPSDGRARLLVLTSRGHACTRAAERAAAASVGRWRQTLGQEQFRTLQTVLHALAGTGPLRPSW